MQDVTNLLVLFISKHQGFYFSMLKRKNLMWSLHVAICVWLLEILCDRSLISKWAQHWHCSAEVQVDFKADFILPFSILTLIILLVCFAEAYSNTYSIMWHCVGENVSRNIINLYFFHILAEKQWKWNKTSSL